MTNDLDNKLKDYYAKTAEWYDAAQLHSNDEHYNALMFLRGIIAEKQYQSVLDVGSGTGRALLYLQNAVPTLKLMGVEPVEELSTIALSKGLKQDQLITGDGYQLPFESNYFDCVTAFGVLHHVERPDEVISEMFRVARKAVFISDHNIYGWGNLSSRLIKQILRKFLGFNLFKLLVTRGVGYHDTDYDGIFYPFSLFDHISQISDSSKQMLIMSTKNKPLHLYAQASHIAIFANLD